MNPDFLDSTARDIVVVTGADAASYLQSQLAQDIDPLGVGEARWTFVLDPTGRVQSLARISRVAENTFELDTDAGFGAPLVARLERFRIRVDAEMELHPAASSVPSAEHEVRRIAAGWPRMGHEIEPDETIPAATGVVPLAVDFKKGCYPGQELVERMNSRGADAPKALRVLDVAEGSSVGDPILDASGGEAGILTSVAGTTGLGYVRRGSEVGRKPGHAG